MATQTTDFPVAREAAAFRAVCDILAEDPALVANGVQVRAWDGDRMDGMAPSFNQGPMAVLSPRVEDARIVTRLINSVSLVIDVKLVVPGLIAEDIANFWGAVRKALERGSPFRGTTVAGYLRDRVRCHRHWASRPGYGAWEKHDEPPTNGLMGVGQVTLILQVAD